MPLQLRLPFAAAARALLRAPGYTVAAAATAAVGIGALTAVFSLVSRALLEPLPYPNADRLVAVQETRDERTISVSWLNLEDYRARTRTLATLGAFYASSFNLTGLGDADRVVGSVVTANLFDALGVRPILGRAFRPDEDAPGSARVVLLSHAMWTTRFGADAAIQGRSITLSGEPFEIVGVMPEGFRFPDGIVYGPADLWLPMAMLPAQGRENRGDHPGLVGVGRLRPGVPVGSARAELGAIAADLVRTYPESNARQGVRVDDAATVILGDVRGGLWLLLGAVALVLLIACANVAGLALARTTARGREIAIRVALGADRPRIWGQILAESLTVGALGGAGGLLVGWVTLRLLGASLADLPRLAGVGLDWRVFALVAGTSVAASALFGLAPAVWAGRLDPDRWLRLKGAGDVAGAGARRAFVVAEVALAMVLLAVGGLLLRSFAALRADTGGIEPGGVLAFNVSLPADPYADTARATGFFTELERRLRAVPGVETVGAVSILPFSGVGAQSGIGRLGDPPGPDYERSTDVMVVTPDYFRAMGIALVRGRMLTANEPLGDFTSVAVVDERFAASFFPGQDPIGQQVQGWGFRGLEIVGVVRHVANYGPATPSREELYVSHQVRPYQRMTVVVRGRGDPAALAAPARAAVREIDPSLPIFLVRPMRAVVDATLAGPRLSAFVSAAFAAVALLLAAIGLYSLIAFQVTQRTREIGVRVAVGARPGAVIGLVVRQALTLVGAGCVAGGLAAAGAVQLVRSRLFGVQPADPWVLAGVAALLLLMALLACLAPAIRAASVSPLIAMRDD